MTGYNDKDGNILVDEKGLYIYPGFGPFIAHEALDCMEKFVLLHQCDKSQMSQLRVRHREASLSRFHWDKTLRPSILSLVLHNLRFRSH